MQNEVLIAWDEGPWLEVVDGDAVVRGVFDRHYSRRRYRDGRCPKLFVGPGYKMVLRSVCGHAVFVWRKFRDRCVDARTGRSQAGVNCAVFRNEGAAGLSSDLIRAAEVRAWRRWPGERLYTYVDASKVRPKRDPGRCFRRAGWVVCGKTRSGKLVLEKLPEVSV